MSSREGWWEEKSTVFLAGAGSLCISSQGSERDAAAQLHLHAAGLGVAVMSRSPHVRALCEQKQQLGCQRVLVSASLLVLAGCGTGRLLERESSCFVFLFLDYRRKRIIFCHGHIILKV